MIKIETNFGDVAKQIEKIGKQAHYAAAVALTRSAQDAREELKAEMGRVFDRPTSYALNSIMVRGANRQRLEAEVWVKDIPAGKGTPADKFMGPQIYGGQRHLKRFERALNRIGVLPTGMYCTPGPAAIIDGNGNMNRSQITQLMSYLSAFGEQGYRANATAKTRDKKWKGNAKKGIRGFEYFAIAQREGKLVPGIYMRKNYTPGERGKVSHMQRDAARAVVFFVRSPSYRKRLAFFEIVTQVAERQVPVHFDVELKKALETAMPTEQQSLL